MHADEHDRRGQDHSNRLFRAQGWPSGSPLRRSLGQRWARVLRCKSQLPPNVKMHDRNGRLRQPWANLHRFEDEYESLCFQLGRMYPPPSPEPEERDFVRIVHFSDGRCVGTSPGPNGESQEQMIEEAERQLAIENLSGGGLPTDAAHVDSWWAGRLWTTGGIGHVATFGHEHLAQGPDAEVSPIGVEPATEDAPADEGSLVVPVTNPAVEVDPPSTQSKPVPPRTSTILGGREYLNSRAFVHDRTMGRRGR